MGQSIREVMTPSPETVESGKTAAEAAKLMKKADAGTGDERRVGETVEQISR
jgi:CBS domain-containing protein